MSKEKTNLFFITHESEEASYFVSLQLPLLKVMSDSGINVKVIRLVSKSSKFHFNTKSSENRGAIGIHNFSLFKTGKAFSILSCCFLISKEVLRLDRSGFNVLVFRSTLPSLIFRILRVISISTFDCVMYDSDGLAVDEELEFRNLGRVDLKYLLGRYLEVFAVVHADAVLVRSSETISVLKLRSKVKVEKNFVELNNGRDVEMFKISNPEERLQSRFELGLEQNDFIIVYSGSIGQQYLLDEMLDLFQTIKEKMKGAKLVFLTPPSVHSEIKRAATSRGIDDGDLVVRFVDALKVGEYLNTADVGLSLRAASDAMRHVKPLKTREYLLCGVPVVYSSGTGDMGKLPPSLARRFDGQAKGEKDDVLSWIITGVVPNREQLRLEARKYAMENFDVRSDARLIIDAIKNLSS